MKKIITVLCMVIISLLFVSGCSLSGNKDIDDNNNGEKVVRGGEAIIETIAEEVKDAFKE